MWIFTGDNSSHLLFDEQVETKYLKKWSDEKGLNVIFSLSSGSPPGITSPFSVGHGELQFKTNDTHSDREYLAKIVQSYPKLMLAFPTTGDLQDCAENIEAGFGSGSFLN